MSQPVQYLTCCCCGNGLFGRQWWNRDDGFGICNGCIAWQRNRDVSEAELQNLYGKEGLHWNLSQEEIILTHA